MRDLNFYENKQINPKGHISMTLFKGTYDNGKINGEILKTYEEHNLIVNMASNLMAGRMAPANTTPRIISTPSYDEFGQITSTTSKETSSKYPLLNGFQYLALGNGLLESEDFQKNDEKNSKKGAYLYDPTTSMSIDEQKIRDSLQNETIRKKITSWAFVDENGDISDKETNILKLTTLFNENDLSSEENGTLFELASSDSSKAYDRHFIVEMGLFGGDATDDANTGYMFNYKLFPAWNKIEGSSLLINWIITF